MGSEPDYELDELTRYYQCEALLAAMQDISEECWAAGWNQGLERDLYRIVFEDALPEYGLSWVTASDRSTLKRWATSADTWFRWSEGEQRPVPLRLSEARARYRCIFTKSVPEGMTVREALALYELSGPDEWVLEPLIEKDVADTPLIQWLHRAREMYRFTTDPSLYLLRRHDFQFVLGYGTCQIELVQPNWLPDEEFLRADGCETNAPCKRIQLCCACAEDAGTHGD